MKTAKYILLLGAALLSCACRGVHEPEEAFSGPGDIVLTLSSQDDITLETKTPAEDLAGGLSFRNVLVILTDNSNIVVGKEYIEEEEVEGVVTPVSTKTITFSNLSPGAYIAYAYANIDQTQWQKSSESGERISTYTSGISVGDNFTSYLSRELASLNASGTDVPSAAGEAMLLTGNMGKLVKVAGGIMNTHSREGDCRMEIMAAAALQCGVSSETCLKILDCVMTDEAIRLIEEEGKKEEVMQNLMEKIMYHLRKRAADRMEIECIVYSSKYGELAQSKGAKKWLTLLVQDLEQPT